MSRPKGSKNKKTIVIDGTGEEMPKFMDDAGVKLPLPETAYDGVKMANNHQDDITDRIAPHVKKAHEAYAKLKTLSPYMETRRKAKGGGQ